jgi:Fe-S-cluster-containing dehydrogenase component
MAKFKGAIIVDIDRCKGCELCVGAFIWLILNHVLAVPTVPLFALMVSSRYTGKKLKTNSVKTII